MDAPMIGHSLLCASEHDGHARLNICGLQKWGHKYPSIDTSMGLSIPTPEYCIDIDTYSEYACSSLTACVPPL